MTGRMADIPSTEWGVTLLAHSLEFYATGASGWRVWPLEGSFSQSVPPSALDFPQACLLLFASLPTVSAYDHFKHSPYEGIAKLGNSIR